MKVGGFKWWHGVVIVAAIAGVAFGLLRTRSGDKLPELAQSITMVDVRTGDLFTFDLSGRRAVRVPETNPQTGEATLLGAVRTDDGKWVIAERHRAALAGIKGEKAAVVDTSTGEVRVSTNSPKRGR